MALFPIFVKLQNRKCVVVGAGKIAAGKAAGLLRNHAKVVVIAPRAGGWIKSKVSAGKLTWHQREFSAKDVAGALLVVAATDSSATNEAVFRACTAAGVLCNVVDDPQHCDFFYPSVVRRGPLQIAISTEGRSPSLARRLRTELERQFGPEYGAWVEHVGKMRNRILSQEPDGRGAAEADRRVFRAGKRSSSSSRERAADRRRQVATRWNRRGNGSRSSDIHRNSTCAALPCWPVTADAGPLYYNSFMDSFIIAGRQFRSRLIVGTGKYRSGQETARAIEASGAEMVTVAVRRVNLDRSKESLLDFIDRKKYFLLPNTAGCYTADEAIRTARLAREVGLSDWVKVEVIGDQATLFPDVQATIEATRVLVKEGFTSAALYLR